MAKKYTAVFKVTHNGKRYNPGDTITMEPEEAAYLVSRGTLAEGKKDPVEPNSGLGKPVIGETKPPENAAKQLTADPGGGPSTPQGDGQNDGDGQTDGEGEDDEGGQAGATE